MKSVSLLILLLALQITLPSVFASGTGLIVLQIQGYGTVHGQLQNAIIQKDDTITMPMVVNDQIQTSQGSYPVVASGVWSGIRNGSSLVGSIQNLNGKIRICFFTKCGDVDFVGVGNWTGALDSSAGGKGTFAAAIAVTNSPYPQIPAGQTIPIYGSWTADFAFLVAEFSWANPAWLLIFVMATSLAITRIGRNRAKNRT